MAEVEDKIKLLEEYEADWYKEVSDYLFQFNTVTHRDNNTLVSNYRDYNSSMLKRTMNQSGAFMINDLWFTIPPQAMQVHMSERSIDIPQIRSKHSVKLATGYGEVSVSVDLVFADDPAAGTTLEDEISYKLIPLLTQLRHMPFAHVENEFLRDKLVDSAEQITGNKVDKNDEADILLTYVSHSISTAEESPRIISLNLQFLLFNYLPYMKKMAYVSDYDRTHMGALPDNTGMIIDRDIVTGKMLHPISNPVLEAFDSIPFYEFHALEMKRSEELMDGYYRHNSETENLSFTYFTYAEIDRKYVDKKYKQKLDKAKISGAVRDTLKLSRGVSGLPCEGRISSRFGMRTLNGVTRMHNGLDIACVNGTPVMTLQGGKVIKSQFESYSGNIVKVLHDNGHITKYMHLSRLGVTEGEVITAGTMIGLSGNTGTSTDAYHLHYEYVINGEYVDPERVHGLSSDSVPLRGPEYAAELDDITVMASEINSPFVIPNEINSPFVIPNISNILEGYDTTPLNTNLPSPEVGPVYGLNKHQELNEANKILAIKEFLESLDPDSWDFIMSSDSDPTVHVRMKHSYNANIPNINGIEILGIENMGGHDVPRIPISGYRYATHQFLGGHTEKVSIHLVSSNSFGDEVVRNIKAIFNIASQNAISKRNVSALDGVGISNTFLNSIVGSEWFMLDDISIKTHPEIPGGSIISITLTDYSRTKEHVQKAFKFKLDSMKNEKSLMKKIVSEMFDLAKPYVIFRELSTSRVIDEWSFLPKVDKSIILNDKRTFLTLVSSTYSQKPLSPGDNKLADLFNDFSKKIATIDFSTSQDDYYDIRGKIDSNGINYKEHNNKIYNFMYKGAEGSKLTAAINTWVWANIKALVSSLPGIAAQYTANVLDEFEQMGSPAYLDFDLPPTIDPDYYFYQPDKYIPHKDSQAKQEFKTERFKKGFEESAKRWKKTTDQLRASKFKEGVDKLDKNIIYGLVAQYENDYYSECAFSENQNKEYEPNVCRNVSIEFDNDAIDSFSDTKIYKINNDLTNKDNILVSPEKFLKYSDDETYAKHMFRVHAARNEEAKTPFDMMRCFPTFKIYILEEDDQEVFNPVRVDFNEMYGLNAIQELRLVQHSDQPTDLLTVRFVDLSGKFTSARFKDKPFTETKKIEYRDTEYENPFDGIMIKEGTRVKCLMGYSNNLNNLDNVFNGQVVSIEGALNEYAMMCQSFGTELVTDIKGSSNPEEITTFNAETKEILNWAITQPEVKHFGRWKLNDPSNLQFSDDTSGFNGLFNNTGIGNFVRLRPDGTKQRVWSWTKGQGDMNILAPEESVYRGLSEQWDMGFEDPLGELWDLGTGLIVFTFFDMINTNYYVHNSTLWDVINEMTYRYPGYVAKVLPFEDRNTLYYGPPDALYYYRPFTIREKMTINGVTNELNRPELARIREKAAYIGNAVNAYNTILARIESRKNSFFLSATAELWDQQDAKAAKDDIERLYNEYNNINPVIRERVDRLVDEEFHERIKSVRPFRNYWLATSENSIVHNKIKADYRGVYNNISVLYSNNEYGDKDASDDIIQKDWARGPLRMPMNDFMKEEDIRTKQIESHNCVGEGAAIRYGAHELHREAKNLYKGTLTMIGEPAISPFDYITVFDDHTQMYGPIEVKQHVISIAPGEGMLSSVTPGMVNSINDMISMSNFDVWQSIMAGNRGQDMAEQIVAGWMPATEVVAGAVMAVPAITSVTGGVSALYGAATGATAATAAGISAGALSIVLLPAMAAGMIAIARKSVQLARTREPIYLHPLIRNGVPYIVGMNTYKTGGLIEWAGDEWQHFKEGLTNWHDAVTAATTDIFNTGL